MDPKTKQLVEEAEVLTVSIYGPFLHDSIEESDIDFLENAPAKMIELCSAVREQDKRARHAEEERDAFDKRINELQAELETQSRREGSLHVMLSNYGLPSEPKAFAGAIEREREANRSRIAELEKENAHLRTLALGA